MTERHVVITGISGGVGRHLAMRAMQEGYAVTGLCRTPPADLPCETLACDVAMADQVADAGFGVAERQGVRERSIART